MSPNRFPVVQEPLEKVLLAELIRCAQLCYQRGWCFGTAGNFSLRVRHEILWQSPSGQNKGDLTGELFVPMLVEDGSVLDPLKSLTPSLEMPIHRGIYLSRPEAKAVVHCHPPFLVANTLQRPGHLSFKDMEMIKALGGEDFKQTIECPVIKNLTFQEMQGAAAWIGHSLGALPALVLEGHGVYAWGPNPLAALAIVEALEFCCQTQAYSQNLEPFSNKSSLPTYK